MDVSEQTITGTTHTVRVQERRSVEYCLAGTSDLVRVVGHYVTVALPPGLPTPERGRRLLGLEGELRARWNGSAEVFLEAKGDLNKLRVRLRGVQI